MLYRNQERFFYLKVLVDPWKKLTTPSFYFFLIETSDPVATWNNNPLQTFWESTDASKFAINVTHSECVGLTVQAQLNGLSHKQLKWLILDALHCVCTVCSCSEITEWKWKGWTGQVERDWQNRSLNDSIPFFKDIDVSGTVQLILSSVFGQVCSASKLLLLDKSLALESKFSQRNEV